MGEFLTHTKSRMPAVAKLKDQPAILDDAQLKQDSEGRAARANLGRFIRDKGLRPAAITRLSEANLFGDLFSSLVLRDPATRTHANLAVPKVLGPSYYFRRRTYRGTPEENEKIDFSIKNSREKSDRRREAAGMGATRIFELETPSQELRDLISDVPVVVLGGGPAGLMATWGLHHLGFRDITVINKSAEYGGIWNQPNVTEGSKNNPVPFDFNGITLDAAPGSGQTVKDFLTQIEANKLLPEITQGVVEGVTPGDLHHTVTYRTPNGDKKTISAPIVINALGIGSPLPPSQEGKMTTNSTTRDKEGIRWQQIWTEEQAERFRDKQIVFIGLGNSTAEMVMQVQKFNREGYNIDYKILTHYPKEAIENPDQEVEKDGKTYRVFRDTSLPNLVKWEGDLPEAEDAYNEALREGKIIPDITHWDMKDKQITITPREGDPTTIDCAQLYTLIGYGHESKVLKAMGMVVTDSGSVAQDYDGEIQRQPGKKGRKRVHAGYFGLGAILKSPQNPNAVVMPGIMHRMYDLAFTAAVRAIETKASHIQDIFVAPRAKKF